MSIFIYAELSIHTPEFYDAYISKAAPIMQAHHVKLHAADTQPRRLTGGEVPDKVVLMEFEDMQHMTAFMSLPEYIAASKDRDAGANMKTTLFTSLSRD